MERNIEKCEGVNIMLIEFIKKDVSKFYYGPSKY